MLKKTDILLRMFGNAVTEKEITIKTLSGNIKNRLIKTITMIYEKKLVNGKVFASNNNGVIEILTKEEKEKKEWKEKVKALTLAEFLELKYF